MKSVVVGIPIVVRESLKKVVKYLLQKTLEVTAAWCKERTLCVQRNKSQEYFRENDISSFLLDKKLRFRKLFEEE